MRSIPIHSKPLSLLAAAFFGIGFTAACSPSANNSEGSGGTKGSGGSSSGSGGSSTSSGGSKGSGGSTGSGGTSSTGSGGTMSTTGSGGKAASGGSTGSGGSGTTGSGGKGSGGSGTTGSGGSGTTGSGGSGTTGSGGSGTTGSGGSGTTGSGGSGTTGSGGMSGGSGGGGGMIAGCMNTDMSSINIDSSGYVCNNQWGIKGAWYCYTDDTSSPCHTSGTIPWNATSKAMCVSGTNAAQKDVVLGFKVNSGPPGDSATPTTWDASKLVGFAVTLAPGASMKGSGGSVLEIEYPTPNDQDSGGAGPGVTVPGVGTTSITYNALFSDSVLANGTARKPVDPANLTDFKIAIPRDTQ